MEEYKQPKQVVQRLNVRRVDDLPKEALQVLLRDIMYKFNLETDEKEAEDIAMHVELFFEDYLEFLPPVIAGLVIDFFRPTMDFFSIYGLCAIRTWRKSFVGDVICRHSRHSRLEFLDSVGMHLYGDALMVEIRPSIAQLPPMVSCVLNWEFTKDLIFVDKNKKKFCFAARVHTLPIYLLDWQPL